MSQNVIASRQIGTRRIAGADWPVELALERVHSRDWQVYVLCNGAASRVRHYKTRWAAWDAYDAEIARMIALAPRMAETLRGLLAYADAARAIVRELDGGVVP